MIMEAKQQMKQAGHSESVVAPSLSLAPHKKNQIWKVIAVIITMGGTHFLTSTIIGGKGTSLILIHQ